MISDLYMRLPNVDMNLFAVFDAIYEERNLTRAAKVLHVTQPAVSNSLRRLREVFNDPLFVRTPRGVSPTPVAANIAPEIRSALHLLNVSLNRGTAFDPLTSEKEYTIGVHDYDEAFLIPKLVARLAKAAPRVSVQCFSVPRRDLEHELAAGDVDLALDVPLFGAPQLCRQKIDSERYVCLLRNDHPASAEPLTLERYLDLDHIHISTRQRGIGHVDMALEQLGLRRKVRLRMRNYLAGPQIVANSDLALTIPGTLAGLHDLKTLELPFIVESLDQYIYWHKSVDLDQANIWLRNTICELAVSE